MEQAGRERAGSQAVELDRRWQEALPLLGVEVGVQRAVPTWGTALTSSVT